MAVSTYGFGTPITSLAPYQAPWGLSLSSATNINPFAAQLPQLLQALPQQLQHLTQLAYLQQQQMQHLQQFVQLIPAQLAQLQQLVQIIPQHIQQTQPLAQFVAGAGAPGLTPWGVSPQLFGGQPGYVM
jgi:hypothetical protein